MKVAKKPTMMCMKHYVQLIDLIHILYIQDFPHPILHLQKVSPLSPKKVKGEKINWGRIFP